MKVKKTIIQIFSLCILIFFPGCVGEDRFEDTPLGNFEELWKIIDERYCFLEYKEIDWNEVYRTYRSKITTNINNENLFEVLGDMLAELKDGHVNLISAHNVSRYWKWFEDYPRNFSESVQENYLGTDYRIAGGIKYKILDDNIGYMYYGSFTSSIGNGNLSEILQHMAICNGIIIDVRNNGGGNLTNSETFASRFTNERVLTGYISHKTGKGHREFSAPKAIYVDPANGIRWQKKVVLLTNRQTYSAANDFVNSMRHFPLVTTLGDVTGGGSGLPFSSELPNGWSVRFSASPHYDSNMQHIEFGIEPDIKLNMSEEDEKKGEDTLIEAARELLKI